MLSAQSQKSTTFQDFDELKSILREMQIDNNQQTSDTFGHYIQTAAEADQIKQTLKEILEQMISEFRKKQDSLQKVINFSMHLLENVQETNSCHQKLKELHSALEVDFGKLMNHNEELTKKIEEMEDQNMQWRQKWEEASTMNQSQSSHHKAVSEVLDLGEHRASPFSIPLVISQFNCFSERLQRKSSTEPQEGQLIKSISQKDCRIRELEEEVRKLEHKTQIYENQIHLKKTEFELSEIFFHEKLQQVKSEIRNNHLEREQCPTPSFEQGTDHLECFSRVESVKSIDSASESEESQFDQNDSSQEQQRHRRKKSIRKSLDQDFLHFSPQDFIQENRTQLSQPLRDSFCQHQLQEIDTDSPKMSLFTSIDLSPKCKVIMCTKAIQTDFTRKNSKRSRKGSISSTGSSDGGEKSLSSIWSLGEKSTYFETLKPNIVGSLKGIFDSAATRFVSSRIKAKKTDKSFSKHN